MRKALFILSLLLSSATAFAQEITSATSLATQEQQVPITVEHEIAKPELAPQQSAEFLLQDSLHLPVINSLGQVQPMGFLGYYPMYWGGWSNWQLHEGLNVSLGASVFAEFGKNARHGAGFTQQLAMQYAVPLTDKLSFSLGGYFTNINWQHSTSRDAGLSAVLGYKFNEKWEAYVYGQKSLVQTNLMPMSVYDLERLGDRVGAAVKYNFSPSVSVQFSVEEHKMPNRWMPEVPGSGTPERK